MFPKASSVIAVVIVIGALFALPFYVTHFYQVGESAAYFRAMRTQGFGRNDTTPEERASYRSAAEEEGRKCAFFMTLGGPLPVAAFALIAVGLFARSVSARRKILLWVAFVCIWILGALFLASGLSLWSPYPGFAQNIGPAVILYLGMAVVLGVVVGFGKFIQHAVARNRP